MPSARRQKRENRKKKQAKLPLVKLFFAVFLAGLVFLFFLFNTRNWDGKSKLIVAEARKDGSVALEILDPAIDEMVVLIISGETEVNSSKNLGTFRLKNIWKLGLQEGDPGGILTGTLVKNFSFPVFLFREEGGKTNIPLGDKLIISYLKKRLGETKKTEIDLAKAQFLQRAKLSDGDLGFKVPEEISPRILIYFANENSGEDPFKVYIKDNTGVYGIAEKVGNLLEVMGGKIFSLERGEVQDSDCAVSGSVNKLTQEVSKILGCEVLKSVSFDLTITLGSRFAKRY